MSKKNNKLAITICTYNRYDVLGEAVNSVLHQIKDSSQQVKLLVVDNNPESLFLENFYKKFSTKEVEVIRCLKLGLSEARNLAIDHLKNYDFIGFIDDDAVISPNWIKEVLDSIDSNPKAGVFGGPVRPIWPDSKPDWVHSDYLGFFTVLDLGSENRVINKKEYFCGTNIIFNRALIEKFGKFNTNLGRSGGVLLSNEELELKNKIQDAGHEAIYIANAIVMHKVHADRLKQPWLRKRIVWQIISDLVTDPSVTSEDLKSKNTYSFIHSFFRKLPPGKRHVRSLFEDQENAEMFKLQIEALNSIAAKILLFPEEYE